MQDWQIWLTLFVFGLALFAMVRGRRTPDVALLGGSVVLALAGVITAEELLQGFSNPGMLTIAALFVVAGGVRETGALDSLGHLMLRRARGQRGLLARLCPQVSVLSAFLNNTAVVAMLLPIVHDWCRRTRVSPARVLLPLSYAAILGGTCTLIGTSTNLIVNGLLIQANHREIGFFELAWVGVPAVVVGLAYMLLAGRRLLPDKKDLLEDYTTAAREYLVNMRVRADSPLAGKQVKEAGLRHLPGLFLIEITRGDHVIAPVAPNEILEAGDRLGFTGQRSTIVDLERMPGLERVEHHADQSRDRETIERYYTEAVVSSTSPLIGRNIRDSNFRARYNAVVIAVHRGGARLAGRVGDIFLKAGDTLLLQTGPNFVKAHSNDPDFYLVSGVREGRPVRRERAWLSLALLAVLVLLMATRVVPVVVAALLVAGLLIFTRCISGPEARRQVQWNVLLAIAGAIALGSALVKSGVAGAVARLLVQATGDLGPIAALAAVYIVAVLFTEVLTNSAAAVLVLPLAMTVASELGLESRPFAMAVVFGASFGFSTPIGYQTNLMVYGPGGYRFTDFAKVGLPLDVLMGIVVVVLIPLIWPLVPATT